MSPRKDKPKITAKFRENDHVRINATFMGPAEIIGATARVTRGSFGRKNGYIHIVMDDKEATGKYLHGDPEVIALPEEIDHLPRSSK